ncbi:MAG: AAA-like domain-containing protein, partial [Pyrinomonadaceae bacterium]
VMGDLRVFISYKHEGDPDRSVAQDVFDILSAHFKVFIDRQMLVGIQWAERINEELESADYMIVLLSETSVLSEMVISEIQRAHELSKASGRPAILPVRLRYAEPFKYPLSAYLNHLNWAEWSGPEDTARLGQTLYKAIYGGSLLNPGPAEARARTGKSADSALPLPAAQPVASMMDEGAVWPGSKFYVVRRSDLIALSAIERDGWTVVIKGPRQMGKSSLLFRVIDKAREFGKRYAYLDFQVIDGRLLKNPDAFYLHFCSWLSDVLEVPDATQEIWKSALGNSQNCTRYVERHILRHSDSNLLLAMDEVDRLFDAEYRSDFFGMLRSWHNNRATSSAWRSLDLAIVTSTEPYQFIENLSQSPFNVGEVVELEDFDFQQVSDLNARYGQPLNEGEVERLMGLLGGQPYLVRRALYVVANGVMSADELFDRAASDDGPFGDHLRHYLFRLHGREELISSLRRTMTEHTLDDELIFFRLRGAGLVRRRGKEVMLRCHLYEDYFRERLNA